MNPIVINILAVVAGIVIGGLLNMGIVMLSSSIIPLPESVDVSNPESLKESMHLLESKHFVFPDGRHFKNACTLFVKTV